MPLPFLIGAAIVGVGTLVGAAAKSVNRDYEIELDSINGKIEKLAEETEENFNQAKKNTEYKLDRLAMYKADIYESSIKDFVNVMRRIKNIELTDNLNLSESLKNVETLFLDYSNNSTVGYIASENEAAIKGAILGGLFGATYLVTGVIKGVKLQYEIDEAKANYSKMKVECEKINQKILALDSIGIRADEMYHILEKLNKYFILAIEELKQTIRYYGTDYKSFNDIHRQQVYVTFQFADAIKKLLDTNVVNHNGDVSVKSGVRISTSQQLIDKYEEKSNE